MGWGFHWNADLDLRDPDASVVGLWYECVCVLVVQDIPCAIYAESLCARLKWPFSMEGQL